MAAKPDRRVQKTHQILQKAMVELIIEKGFDAIRIQDILDKANVGRSTFYAHFQDKAELLHSCFEDVHHIFELREGNISNEVRSFPDMLTDSAFILEFLKYAEQNGQLFKALLRQPEIIRMINASLFEYINGPIKRWLERQKRPSISSELVTHYFISAFFGIVQWWINNDIPCSAEKLDQSFKKLALPSLKSILDLD